MRTGSPLGRPGRPRRLTRLGVVGVLTWVLAVVVGGAVAWRAMGVVDSGERAGVLSRSEVAAELADARATASSTPSATPGTSPTGTPAATPSPTATPTDSQTPRETPTPEPSRTARPTEPATSEVARTWTVPGGVVAVLCRGATISLLYATPSDGWTVEVGSAGPEHVEVELRRDDAETKLKAECVGGTPQRELRTDDGGDSHDDDSTRAPEPGDD